MCSIVITIETHICVPTLYNHMIHQLLNRRSFSEHLGLTQYFYRPLALTDPLHVQLYVTLTYRQHTAPSRTTGPKHLDATPDVYTSRQLRTLGYLDF